MPKKLKLVITSDTHNRHHLLNLPQGDILIHAGDMTVHGRIEEIKAFNQWLKGQKFRYKICIAGNHDFLFENKPELARSLLKKVVYLEDSGFQAEGLNFWGSPVTPRFRDFAFNRDRGKDIKKHWDMIPDNTDILIVHGPPYSILDKIHTGEHVGCEELMNRIKTIKPKLVIFGHIHESFGIVEQEGTTFINACFLNRLYMPNNEPAVIEL